MRPSFAHTVHGSFPSLAAAAGAASFDLTPARYARRSQSRSLYPPRLAPTSPPRSSAAVAPFPFSRARRPLLYSPFPLLDWSEAHTHNEHYDRLAVYLRPAPRRARERESPVPACASRPSQVGSALPSFVRHSACTVQALLVRSEEIPEPDSIAPAATSSTLAGAS